MKQEWRYSDAEFDADKYNDTMLRFSPWSGHRRFGYDLIAYFEPKILVELGSFYGCSSFAFMQAIKDYQLDTEMYPIDLWEVGDVFTVHDYEQDIYSFFKNVKEKEFSDINVKMMKMTFDKASLYFEEHSIDILHIDGSHSYEDVKHDFMTWKPKLKQNAIVLFHDISEQLLYGESLGSCKFWKEIKKEYNWTVEMQYSWGLGILFLAEDTFRNFDRNVDINYYLKLNTYEETICKDRIRKDYFKLQDAEKWINSLKKDKCILEKDNKKLVNELQELKFNYEDTIEGKEKYIIQLTEEAKIWQENSKTIQLEYEKTIHEKDLYIKELQRIVENNSKDNDDIKLKFNDTIQGKDAYISELQEKLIIFQNENCKIKNDYEETIKGKDAYIEELEIAVKLFKEKLGTLEVDSDRSIYE